MLKFKSLQSPSSQGFTIVEMLVVAPIVILLIGAFITAIVNMTGDVLASRGASTLAYDIQDTLNRIEDDVKLSTTFLDSNNINLTSPQGFGNDTTGFTNVDAAKGDMLVLNVLATNATPLASSTGLIYLTNQPNACSDVLVSQNTPMTMNIIYFIKDGTLWRRTVAASTYASAGCTLPYQQPSCNPTYMAANPGSSTFCKTQDIRLLDGVNPGDLTILYFNSSSSTVANTVASDVTALPATRYAALQSLTTVSVSLNITKSAGGRQISQSGTLRASKLDVNSSIIATTTATTVPPAPSGLSAALSSPGQINVTWYAAAPSYTLQYDTTSSFSAPTTVASGITTTNRLVTGLNGSPTYYFRVRGDNSAGAGTWSSAVSQSSTITNGLVGWWRFNGDASDASGSNNNGTLVAAPTLGVGQNGQANGAYTFNGTTQYISINSVFGLGTTNMTLSAWMYNTTTTNSGTFIKIGNSTSNGVAIGTGSTVADNTSPGTKIVAWYDGVRWIATPTDVGTAWHYIVLVVDATGAPSVYRDGVFTGLYAGGNIVAPSTSSAIGGQLGATRFFTGRLDDIRVYNRPLTGSEITGLYNAGAQ
jgi:hypothetical protein